MPGEGVIQAFACGAFALTMRARSSCGSNWLIEVGRVKFSAQNALPMYHRYRILKATPRWSNEGRELGEDGVDRRQDEPRISSACESHSDVFFQKDQKKICGRDGRDTAVCAQLA
jgi:hypothetical protein